MKRLTFLFIALVSYNIISVIILPLYKEYEPQTTLNCNIDRSGHFETLEYRRTIKDQFSDEGVNNRSMDCSNYHDTLSQLLNERIHKLREIHPIGFSILLHDDLGVFEILLKQIFRPHHSFCIHIDRKASPIVHETVANIVSCYKTKHPNTTIFVSDVNLDVIWGDISLVDVDLDCMRRLRLS